MIRRCPRTAHTWRIYATLPMGIVQADKFYPVLIIRYCKVCGYTECWAGEQNVEAQIVRLHEAWEARER